MMRLRKGGGGGLSVSNGRSKETKELMRVADVTTTDPCTNDDDDDEEAACGRSSNRGNRGSCRVFCNSRLINGKVTASLVKTYADAWT